MPPRKQSPRREARRLQEQYALLTLGMDPTEAPPAPAVLTPIQAAISQMGSSSSTADVGAVQPTSSGAPASTETTVDSSHDAVNAEVASFVSAMTDATNVEAVVIT